MALTVADKAAIMAKFARGEADTGSPEVQVALLSAQIDDLQSHFAVGLVSISFCF